MDNLTEKSFKGHESYKLNFRGNKSRSSRSGSGSSHSGSGSSHSGSGSSQSGSSVSVSFSRPFSE